MHTGSLLYTCLISSKNASRTSVPFLFTFESELPFEPSMACSKSFSGGPITNLFSPAVPQSLSLVSFKAVCQMYFSNSNKSCVVCPCTNWKIKLEFVISSESPIYNLVDTGSAGSLLGSIWLPGSGNMSLLLLGGRAASGSL